MTRRPLPVTDHAVLRYMERVMGVDVDGIRRQIGREAAEAAALIPLGDPCAIVVTGMRMVIEDRRIVTVERPCRPNRASGRQRRERPE